MKQLIHSDITGVIVPLFYDVYRNLGFGFLERVYENAMVLELTAAGLDVRQQAPTKVFYKNTVVGDFFADIIVENLVVLELKAVQHVSKAHEVQLVNYLKATQIEVGLPLNFGETPECRRRILTNDRK
jgi:GxxExxY protein